MYASSTATNAVAVDSGTTDAATEDKLTDSAQTFISAGVVAGDYAVITTGIAGYPVRTWSKVTEVDSETVLTISGAGNSGTAGLSASGTVFSIIAAADISKCVLSGATFNTDVKGGDVVCNETTNLNYTVASVTDATTIVLAGDNFGILVGDDFFILSDRGSQGSRKVRLDNATEIRGSAANGRVTICYKKGSASYDALTIIMGDTVTDDAYFIKFKEVAQNIMKSPWTVNSGQMPLVLSSGTQGIQWATTFGFS